MTSNQNPRSESRHTNNPDNASSIYSSSTADSSSLFSRHQASTLSSSAYSAASHHGKQPPQTGPLMRVLMPNQYDPAPPEDLQTQQQSSPFHSSSTSSSTGRRRPSFRSGATMIPDVSGTTPTPAFSFTPASSSSATPIPSSANPLFPSTSLDPANTPPPSTLFLRESNLDTDSATSETAASYAFDPSSSFLPPQASSSPLTAHQQAPPPPPPPPPPPELPQASQQDIHAALNELERLSEALIRFKYDSSNWVGSNLLPTAIDICAIMGNAVNSPSLKNIAAGSISVFQQNPLVKIITIVFHFVDFYLHIPSMAVRKSVLLRHLYQLGVLLQILPEHSGPVREPQIFAMGSSEEEIPYIDDVITTLDLMATQDSSLIQDQDGAFVAPVLRGFSPDFAVPAYYFGYPSLLPEHREAVLNMSILSHDFSYFCVQNYIRPAGMEVQSPSAVPPTVQPTNSRAPTNDFQGFMAPFRVPRDSNAPPISVSISNVSNSNASGTLGGYLFPIVDPSNKQLAAYAKSTYALTCGHVCLKKSSSARYPKVSVPSTFMINFFRAKLLDDRKHYPPGSPEYNIYTKALAEIQTRYFTPDRDGTTPLENSFGQVAWGEREVVNKQLSDIAIIRCNDDLKCRNYLGDDIPFTEYDTSLRFGYLHVKSVVQNLMGGMKVFKYGSTTKYTSGVLNGVRLIYWSERTLQSSEFVVESGGPFADGGDSGAWILHKNSADSTLNNSNAPAASPSLGVVGMLHSYDGTRKELGLFTPMSRILDRLQEVTQIQWGVVGIPEKNDSPVDSGLSDSSNNSDDDYEGAGLTSDSENINSIQATPPGPSGMASLTRFMK